MAGCAIMPPDGLPGCGARGDRVAKGAGLPAGRPHLAGRPPFVSCAVGHLTAWASGSMGTVPVPGEIGGRIWRILVGRINRYVMREVAGPSLLALPVFAFLGVANELRERMGLFDITYAHISDFAKLSLWFLPTLLYYVVPVMYMMGIMLAFGRLAKDNEITAMRAAGIPLKRIVAPVILGGAILSALCFVLQDRIQPIALRKINNLIYVELHRRATMDAFPPGVMHELGDWRVYIGGRDRSTNALSNVDILIPQDNGDIHLYHADRARFSSESGRPMLTIEDGYVIMPGAGGRGHIPNFQLAAPAPDTAKAAGERRTMNLRELLAWDKKLEGELIEKAALEDLQPVYAIHDLRKDFEQIPENVPLDTLRELLMTRAEIRERISLPLACLAVSLLAAPLAVRGGRGGRSFSFAIGFGVCLAYYLIWAGTQPGARLCSLTEAVFRGLIPNIVMALGGIWALWRVDRV